MGRQWKFFTTCWVSKDLILVTFRKKKHYKLYFLKCIDLGICFSKLRLHSLVGWSDATNQCKSTSNKFLFSLQEKWKMRYGDIILIGVRKIHNYRVYIASHLLEPWVEGGSHPFCSYGDWLRGTIGILIDVASNELLLYMAQ